MLINGSASDVASSWERHLSTFVFSKHGSDKIVRSPNPSDIFIINRDFPDGFSINTDRMSVDPIHFRADFFNRF